MKRILCFILCIVTILSLTACGTFSDKPDINNTNTSDNSETVTKPSESDDSSTPSEPTDIEDLESEYSANSVEYAAQQFIKSLIDGNYDVALRCFNIPEKTPYFTAQDVEWYLPRSNYADASTIKFEKYTITVDTNKNNAENATCVVTVKDTDSDKNKTFTLNMVLDNTNKWGVKDNDFYLDEYYVVAPGGDAILTVNGVDACDDYEDKYGSYKYRSLYKLEHVGKSEKVFAVSSDNFDTYEEKIYPVKNTKDEPTLVVVEDNKQEALDYLKTTWADVYQGVLDDKAYSEMVYLLSPNADPALAQVMMTGIDIMTNEGVNHSFKVVEMSFCTDDSMKTHWLSDNKLIVSFNYTLNWIKDPSYAKPTSKTMKNYDQIVLHYDGKNFTIDSISAKNTFFTECDYMTNKVM